MKKIKKKVTSLLELPKEIVYNLPYITLTGKEEINIENYKGIIEYSEDVMRINSAIGIIRITGKKLSLKQVTSENVTIAGMISKVEYLV